MTAGIHARCRRNKRAGAFTAILAATTMVAGCAEAPKQFAGLSPADPSVRVATTTYQPVIAPYKSMRPAEPEPWRQQNEKVAPPSRPEK